MRNPRQNRRGFFLCVERGIFDGYDGTVSADEAVMLLERSFDLTWGKKVRKKREIFSE